MRYGTDGSLRFRPPREPRREPTPASLGVPPGILLRQYADDTWDVFVLHRGAVAWSRSPEACIAVLRLYGGERLVRENLEYYAAIGCRSPHGALDALKAALR